MTIAKRLYVLIFVVVLGMMGLAGVGIYEMDRVYTATNYANVNTVPSLLDLDDAYDAFTKMRVQVWKYISLKDPALRSELMTQIHTAHDKVVVALNKYEKEDISDDKDKAMLAEDRQGFDKYNVLLTKVIAAADAQQDSDADQLLYTGQAVINKSNDDFDKHRKYNRDLGQQAAATAVATIHNANEMAILIAALVIIGIATMGILLARKISTSLQEGVKIAQAVASGDLTNQITVHGSDEVGQLLQALKEMNDSMKKIVSNVRAGTETISTASGEIATGNLDLSSRTERQAASLQETASSMEELTSTVKQNADNSKQASQLAISASEVAIKGGAVVSQVIDTMGEINESAKKIVDIIGVIDGIAFQTNILALNAAVEAARAGEQGRGFAVVATEVRNLAQRSAGAAKEIKALIGASVEKVETGSKLVDQAGVTMDEVVASVKRVTDIINEITAASHEQTTGIEQINLAVIQMDEATQQNAALVEEAAAASQSLQDQAGSLVKLVGVFKIDQASSMSTTSIPVSSPSARNSAGIIPIRKTDEAANKKVALVKPLKKVSNSDMGDDWQEF